MSCAASCSVAELASPDMKIVAAPRQATKRIDISPEVDLAAVVLIAFIVVSICRHTRRRSRFTLHGRSPDLRVKASFPPSRRISPSGRWKAARRLQSRGRLGPWVPPLVHPSPFPFQFLTLRALGTPCKTIWTSGGHPVKAESGRAMSAGDDSRLCCDKLARPHQPTFSLAQIFRLGRTLSAGRHTKMRQNSAGDSRNGLGPKCAQRPRISQIAIG